MQRIIVVGSKGFIGKRLVAELRQHGNEVVEIDMDDHIEDVSGSWDVMYNMAWVGKGGALRADYNVQMGNVKLGLELYSQARRLGCKKYICMGTIGEKMSRLPECSHIKSQNLIYAISKNYLHDILNTIEVPECKVVWTVLGNIYGGSDAGGNIVDYCLRNVLVGKEAVFGPAEQPYDFIYVDDAVRALVAIGQSDCVASSEFYIGCGRPRLLKEFLMEIGRIAGCPQLMRIGGRPDDGTRYHKEWFDITNLTAETGFVPTISFEIGVRKNVDSLQGVL